MPFLLLLFVVVPIAELAVLIQVGQWLGLWPTLALLVLDAALGTVLMRTQGRLVWRRFSAALAAGHPPAREVVDGGLVLFGGALLVAPGFLTDVLGFALLLPPTRALVRSVLLRRLAAGLTVRVAGGRQGRPAAFGGPRPRRGSPGHDDVDSTATEVDQRHLP